MRAHLSGRLGPLLLLLASAAAFAQPGGGKNQGPVDEDKEIIRQIREAYKAPLEVHQDVADELRQSIRQPSEKREATIFRDLRRLYQLTPEREAAILSEIRKAYTQPSVEQQQRVFQEIAKAERLPEGTVPASMQVEYAGKLFRRLDSNGDGRLSRDEMSETLDGERGRWDSNRDGVINPDEYWAFYQSRLRWLSEQVANGNIDLGLRRGGPAVAAIPMREEDARPTVYRAGKLPKGLPGWFEQLDADKDGQVSLYEWRKASKALEEFAALDHNQDGLVTPYEVLRYQTQNPEATAAANARHHVPLHVHEKKGKKK